VIPFKDPDPFQEFDSYRARGQARDCRLSARAARLSKEDRLYRHILAETLDRRTISTASAAISATEPNPGNHAD